MIPRFVEIRVHWLATWLTQVGKRRLTGVKTRLIHCIFAVFAAGAAFAQDKPAFDAVSIKPSAPDARGSGYRPSPGRLTMKNLSLKDLVEFAWNLHDYQLSGGPGWAATDRYDLIASFPADTPDARRALMMQATLADRFALGVRQESKEISGYTLTVGKNGHKLHVADGTDHELMLGRSPATGQRTLTAGSAKMADVASLLADLLARPVVNKTDLQGLFDFKLAWTPDSGTDLPRKGGPEAPPPPAESEPGPSLFTALQETLGLKLETGKVTVETIVIERAEKPSEN